MNNDGNHLEEGDPFQRSEMEKLFWKFPLIIAGMYAAERSFLPFHILFHPKLRGQHGSGITALEPKIVEHYSDLGKTDGEIFKKMVQKGFMLSDDYAG